MGKDIFDKILERVEEARSSVHSASRGGTFAKTGKILRRLTDQARELEEGEDIEKAWFEEALFGFNDLAIWSLKNGYSVQQSGAYVYHRNFLAFFREVGRETCLASLPLLIKAYRKAQRTAKHSVDKKWFAVRLQRLEELRQTLFAAEHEEITGEIRL